MRVSQCYIGMPAAAESIVLAVFQRGEANGPSPKAMWKQIFDRAADDERAHEGEREHEIEGQHGSGAGEEESRRPEKIAGVGEEAFVMPQRFGAAIYVLKGNNVVRLSIGGGGSDVHEKKVATLQAIAEAVLQSL